MVLGERVSDKCQAVLLVLVISGKRDHRRPGLGLKKNLKATNGRQMMAVLVD
jgi:hypothetical protein